MIGIKEFNKKIASLKNTRKMTKTMKMVSASKFKRAYKAQANAQVYAERLTDLMRRLSGVGVQHPLMTAKPNPRKVLVVLFTSDKGLCGGFNNNLLRAFKRWLAEQSSKYPQIDLYFCGRRGYMAFRRLPAAKKHYENITVKPQFNDAAAVAGELTDLFVKGEYDEVYLAYEHFNSPMSQDPTVERLLPMAQPAAEGAKKPASDYMYEPDQRDLFHFLIPKYLAFKIYYTLLENAAGEHGARMSAMDKASQNTADLIDRYILLRNRARQAAITTELIEIISGAEALK